MANNILNEIGKAGQKTRKVYQRRLPEDQTKDYYYIQRLTPNTESLLIEYGFIDNVNDIKKLDTNLLDYAEAVVKAVSNYANVLYKAPGVTVSNEYIVKSGDTMYSIAKKYDTSVEKLKNYNFLTSDLLSIGQILKIPANSTNNKTYTVTTGDTLYSISKKTGIPIETIKDLNNLSPNLLYVGQVLTLS